MAKAQKVKIVPTDDIPVPYNTDNDQTGSLLEELAVAGKTAELQEALGAKIILSTEDAEKEAALLKEVIEKGKVINLRNPGVALAANGFLKTYGQALGMDLVAMRNAVKNKLFEIANCGEPRYELRALELLGKTSDIALFTERSEINVNYKTSIDLESAIVERVKRLLNATVVESVPLSMEDLDEELGVFEELEDENETDDQDQISELTASVEELIEDDGCTDVNSI